MVRAYPIKDLDDHEGLILSHPQKRIISVLKHAMELSDMLFRVRVKLGEFFEHGNVRGGLLQKIDELGH